MVATTAVSSRNSSIKVISRSVVGVILALAAVFCSGAAAVTYLSDGLAWLGLLMAMATMAGAVLVSLWSPLSGLISGSLLALLMIYFVSMGMIPNASRPAGGIDGIILFGSAGILTAALVGAFLASALGAGLVARRHSS